jgi:hypothetical protein
MSSYFEKPDIDLAGKRIIAVFTIFNEAERIPFFLDYYRRMGVDHFLAIDNNSADNSRELLQDQPDITCFHTTESYVASKAGRLWTSELADHYCIGRWCLTLDIDEQLVFPGCEHVTLVALCDYLHEHSFDGLFTVFLDMYHPGPLSEAIYTPGQPFLDVCDHFEVSNYTLQQPMHFPHVVVFGGPRQRLFWASGRKGRGPAMRKMPLIKWQPGFKYLHSTHSSTPVRLADVTGALLHFKFFSSFTSFAERELVRGDRVKTADYEAYVRLTKDQDLNFGSEHSIRYEGSAQLVEQGISVCTRRYLNWLRPRLCDAIGHVNARKYDARLRDAMRGAEERATLELSHLPLVWSLMGRRTEGEILSVLGRTVLGWFVDRSGIAPSEEIEARMASQVVAVGTAGASLWDYAVVEPELRHRIFQVSIPGWDSSAGDPVRVVFAARGDSVPFASVTLNRAGKVSGTEFEGACYLTPERRIGGWAWMPHEPRQTVQVVIHIDGQFWQRTTANLVRPQLKERGIGSGKHGFLIELPEGLEPTCPHVVDVVIHGTNYQLTRSPLTVPVTQAPEQNRPRTRRSRPVISRTSFTALPTLGDGLAGGILAIRSGVIYGWVVDERIDARVLGVELVAGGRGRRVVAADAALPLAGGGPLEWRDHGFVMPVFPPSARKEYRKVSLRIVGTPDMLVGGLIVASPKVTMDGSKYRGCCEPDDEGVLHGWVWRPGSPEERIEVALFVDDRFWTVVEASTRRDDLRTRGIGDGCHGFAVPLLRQYLSGATHVIHAVTAWEGIALGDSPMVVVGRTVQLGTAPPKRRRAARYPDVATVPDALSGDSSR